MAGAVQLMRRWNQPMIRVKFVCDITVHSKQVSGCGGDGCSCGVSAPSGTNASLEMAKDQVDKQVTSRVLTCQVECGCSDQ